MNAQSTTGLNSPCDVVVVGSLNADLSFVVETFPAAGETVFGSDLLRGGGGKGANQAVAAARLGRRVAMVGCVGDDDNGRMLVNGLHIEGIDCGHVRELADQPTGMAVIEVDTQGENRIVVISGANDVVCSVDLNDAARQIQDAAVILAQLEVPVETVNAMSAMKRSGVLVVNPAPASAELDLTNVDVVVPNRGELAALVQGAESQSIDEIAAQAKQLATAGCAVVVTLGSDGAMVVESADSPVEHIQPMKVDVVDTTAAGDAFCGGLVDALCSGASYRQAAHWANSVGALATTRRGAQASLPHRQEVENFT